MSSPNVPDRLDDLECFIPKPFVIFEAPDFLPAGLFERLERTWPDPSSYRYSSHATGSKLYLDSLDRDFGRFMRSHDEWRGLFEYFSADDTATQLWRLCAPYLGSRPAAEQEPWRMVPPPSNKLSARIARRIGRSRLTGRRARRGRTDAGTTDVFLGFEFSVLRDGARIPPHTDTPGKLLSLMLYFPSEGQEDLHLGTEFYEGRSGRETAREWRTGMPGEEETKAFLDDHECFFQSSFTGRKLIGFVKSDVSWHGLGPVDPGAGGRRAVVINYFCRSPAPV